MNDVLYMRAASLQLGSWRPSEFAGDEAIRGVENALRTLEAQPFSAFVVELNRALASFDWRTSSTPDLDEPLRRAKLVFRGSSGYKELRIQLLEHLSRGEGDIAATASRLLELS
jgi:hypothetical protein